MDIHAAYRAIEHDAAKYFYSGYDLVYYHGAICRAGHVILEHDGAHTLVLR